MSTEMTAPTIEKDTPTCSPVSSDVERTILFTVYGDGQYPCVITGILSAHHCNDDELHLVIKNPEIII